MIFVDKNLENTLVMDHAGWPVRAQYQASAFVQGMTVRGCGLIWLYSGITRGAHWGFEGYVRMCNNCRAYSLLLQTKSNPLNGPKNGSALSKASSWAPKCTV